MSRGRRVKYLVVVVDIYSNKFDIEPIKNKDALTVLNALKTIWKRGKYVKEPEYTFITDDGAEFKGPVTKFLYDESIFHKISLPNRHSQTANVESLNRQLGELLNGYMNTKELETGKVYKEWTDVIKPLRTELNKARVTFKSKNPYTYDYKTVDNVKEPKYQVGDVVYRASDYPLNALGHKQPTNNFRQGDYRWHMVPVKIVKVLDMNDENVPFRYMLEGIDRASFTESQLMKAPEKEKDTKYVVKSIFGKRKNKNDTEYLVWWKGYKKSEATYESEKNLIKDGLQSMIDDYEKSIKK